MGGQHSPLSPSFSLSLPLSPSLSLSLPLHPSLPSILSLSLSGKVSCFIQSNSRHGLHTRDYMERRECPRQSGLCQNCWHSSSHTLSINSTHIHTTPYLPPLSPPVPLPLSPSPFSHHLSQHQFTEQNRSKGNGVYRDKLKHFLKVNVA